MPAARARRAASAAAPRPWGRWGFSFLVAAATACVAVLWWFAAGEPEGMLRPVRAAVALSLGS